MPALIPTPYRAKIIWLGFCPAESDSLQSQVVETLTIGLDGLAGERHAGLTRLSCGRVVSQYPVGTEIRNTRQLSLVASEELAEIAGKMGVDALDPSWLGANIVLEGFPDFSLVPPSSRLCADSGAALCVDMQNHPCNYPAKVIESFLPGRGRAFRAAAKGRRGVTAWVERAGILRIGDVFRLHVPSQRPWAPE